MCFVIDKENAVDVLYISGPDAHSFSITGVVTGGLNAM